MKMVWSSVSSHSLRDLEYFSGSKAAETLMKVAKSQQGWVCLVYPYTPILCINRQTNVTTLEVINDEYKEKEEWLDRLLEKYPDILDKLPAKTKLYFNADLKPLSARRNNEKLTGVELGTLANQIGIRPGHHMLDVRSVVHMALETFITKKTDDFQRMALYLPGEKPFHISSYCLPELLVAGFENYLLDLGTAEREDIEKIFWYAVRSTSREWFEITKDMKISKPDIEKIRKVNTSLLGV